MAAPQAEVCLPDRDIVLVMNVPPSTYLYSQPSKPFRNRHKIWFFSLRQLLLVLFWFAIPVPSGADLHEGLLLYYSFDQDESGRVTDVSGNGRNARVQGPTWISEGARGGAYHFQREGETITTSDAGLPMGDAPRTLSWWFSLDSLRPGKHSTEMINYGSIQHSRFFVAAIDWRIGRDCPILSPWGWVFISQCRIERAQQWHHAVLTYAGQGQFTYFINGQRCHGYNENPSPLQTQPGGYFRIGRFNEEVHGLDGCIDEVRVYSRVLDQAEVTELYLQGLETARTLSDSSTGALVTVPPHHHAQNPLPSPAESTPPVATRTGLAKPDAPVELSASEYQVSRIGFSTDEHGDRDVTIFYTDETMHVWVQDVDLNPADTNILVKVSLYQQDEHEGHADLSVTMQARTDGSFKSEIPLHTLRPGRALVDIAGYDLSGRVLRLFRTAPITLRDPNKTE